ncbi:hypothetical protein [Nocardia araoensis]|uniref:hypothetical protein n=1 Tax=Nocardia araoensis TaxID=228600 RepID=UPI0002FC4F2F|nr:hypothetical protein [Nocardia araoensis]
MTTNHRSTRRSARALAIAAAPALLGMGLLTAGVAQAGPDPNLPTCSNVMCGPQTTPTPSGQTNLTPGTVPNVSPGIPADRTPGAAHRPSHFA